MIGSKYSPARVSLALEPCSEVWSSWFVTCPVPVIENGHAVGVVTPAGYYQVSVHVEQCDGCCRKTREIPCPEELLMVTWLIWFNSFLLIATRSPGRHPAHSCMLVPVLVPSHDSLLCSNGQSFGVFLCWLRFQLGSREMQLIVQELGQGEGTKMHSRKGNT